MKTKYILSFIILSLGWLIALVGCSDDKTEALVEPTLEISGKALTFTYEGERQEIVVTTNQPKWFVVTSAKDKSWCVVSMNGNKLGVRAELNPKEEKREAVISVVVAGSLCETIVVSQAAAPPVPVLAVSGETGFTYKGNVKTLNVITNQEDWLASVDEDNRSWCTIAGDKEKNTLTVTVTENPGDERIATITVTAGMAPSVLLQVLQQSKDASEVVSVDIPAFSESFVYSVQLEGQKIAEVCNEFIPAFSVEKRATVAYPVVQGKVDLTRGYLVDNGGTVAWNVEDGSCTYTAGTLKGGTKLYISGKTIRTVGNATKVGTAVADQLTDVERNNYKLVKVGTQYWMAENLKTVTYNDGSEIAGLVGASEGGYFVYENSREGITADKDIRGCLYNYAALSKLAPTGWHVPTLEEWNGLKRYVGEHDGVLQMEGVWEYMSLPGMNATGFSAKPGGYCFDTGKCMSGTSMGAWWSTTESQDEVSQANWVQLDELGKIMTDNYYEKTCGYSVRLVRD